MATLKPRAALTHGSLPLPTPFRRLNPLAPLLCAGLSTLAPLPLANAFVGNHPPSRLSGPSHTDQRVHPLAQERLSLSDLFWPAFSAAHPLWQVRWNELTGTPYRLMGDGLNFGPLSSPPLAAQTGLNALTHLAPLLQVAPDALIPLADQARGDLHFVVYQQSVAGFPIEGALVQLRFKQGRLVMVASETHPEGLVLQSVTLPPRLSAREALAVSRSSLSGPSTVMGESELRILPVEGVEGLSYRLVWHTLLETPDPSPGQWHSFVDALTGGLLAQYNDVRFAWSGTLSGGHEQRTVGDPVITSPLKNAKVKARINSVLTNSAGAYSMVGTGSTTLTASFDGDLIRVVNKAGNNAAPTFAATSSAPANYNFGFGTVASPAEQDTQWHAHIVREKALQITPELADLQDRLTANVNVAGSCNAYFNGVNINFYVESTDCNNTGRIADVIYHEYGHYYHSALVVSGFVDGTIGEGSGDYLAATITNDPNVAPNFNKDGSGIRNLEPDLVYPNDLVGEIHADGLIWGGAMWDLRKRLAKDLGASAGISLADRLFAGTLMSGPTLDSAYEDMLLADDDNGNLADGTPHRCVITEELGRHGLGPGVRAVFTHADSPTLSATAATTLKVGISSTDSACLTLNPSTAKLLWATNPNGPFATINMSGNANNYNAVLPAQPAGTLLYYTFTIQYLTGKTLSANHGESYALYQAYVGNLTTLVCEDFEGDNGGYIHALDGGDGGGGADDWMWGAPDGAAGDPDQAASGTSVWGNDLGPSGYNGGYQPNKSNHLESIAYNTSGHTGVMLRYRRWLGVEDAAGDQAVISINGTPVWQNQASADGTHHTIDTRWTWHYLKLNGLADNKSSVLLRWSLTSNEAVEFGGWNIDDVCLVK